MSILQDLANAAAADIDLLRMRDGQGDVFARTRPVDFVFVTSDSTRASAVAGYLYDYGYAETSVSPNDGRHVVVATMAMPVEQSVILAVSGFMQCIAALFEVTYDGWGAPVVTAG